MTLSRFQGVLRRRGDVLALPHTPTTAPAGGIAHFRYRPLLAVPHRPLRFGAAGLAGSHIRRNARSRICRTFSRVMPSAAPICSNVWSAFPSSPNDRRIISASRADNCARSDRIKQPPLDVAQRTPITHQHITHGGPALPNPLVQTRPTRALSRPSTSAITGSDGESLTLLVRRRHRRLA
jgi:hypothetical protein